MTYMVINMNLKLYSLFMCILGGDSFAIKVAGKGFFLFLKIPYFLNSIYYFFCKELNSTKLILNVREYFTKLKK